MGRKTATDHLASLVKAGVNAIPVVGGPLASLLEDYLPAFKDKALSSALEETRRRLAQLEGRVAVDALPQDQLIELFVALYLMVSRTMSREKHRVAAGILVNALLKVGDPEKLSDTELDHFLKCIESLSLGAVHVLGVFKRIVAGSQSRKDGRVNFEHLRREATVADSRTAIHNNADLVMGLVGELARFNLIHMPGAPTITTPEYGNYPLTLTSQGRTFVERLLGER